MEMPFDNAPREGLALAVLLTLVCAGLGALTVAYVDLVGESPLRIFFLPMLLLLGIVLVLDRRHLFLAIMLFRSAADPVFDAAKFNVGSAQIGMGAALNALVILIAALFLIERPKVAGTPLLARWAVLPLLLAAIAAAHSPDPGAAVRTLLVLISYGAVFVIPFHLVQSPADRQRCFDLVIWSSLLPVLYAGVDLAQGWGSEGFRLKSTFSHPNIFAFYLLLVAGLLFYRLKAVTTTATFMRMVSVGYLLLLLALLALTQTRSAWLAALLVFGVYAIRFERRYLLYLPIALVLLFVLMPGLSDRVNDLSASKSFDQYPKLNSFDWRLEIWKSGLSWMRLDHLPLGYGLDAFIWHSPDFFPLAGNIHPGAHNVYVQWLFETGITGIAMLAWIFSRLFRRLAAATESVGATLLMSLVAGYLLVCASDNLVDYLSFNWYFWFVMGAACAAQEQGAAPRQPRSTL